VALAKKFTIHIYCQGISPKTATGNAGPLALSPSEIADLGTKFDAEAHAWARINPTMSVKACASVTASV
jgi:hypothetical protein